MNTDEDESEEDPLPDIPPPDGSGSGGAGDGSGKKRKRHQQGSRRDSRSGDQLHQMTDIKEFLGSILTNSFSGMTAMFRENHEMEKARKAEEALERQNSKKKKTEDEMLETPATVVVFDGKDLQDNCRDVINSDLRAVLVGPFGDPESWFSGKMTADKPECIIGDAVDYTYMLGADHINRRTIRLSQSRFKFIELKCWSSENSGIVKDLEILIQHAEVSVGFHPAVWQS